MRTISIPRSQRMDLTKVGHCCSSCSSAADTPPNNITANRCHAMKKQQQAELPFMSAVGSRCHNACKWLWPAHTTLRLTLACLSQPALFCYVQHRIQTIEQATRTRIEMEKDSGQAELEVDIRGAEANINDAVAKIEIIIREQGATFTLPPPLPLTLPLHTYAPPPSSPRDIMFPT